MTARKPTPDLMGPIDIMDDILSAGTQPPAVVSWHGKELDYPIDRIQIGKRLRPLGDVTTLAESINQVGLLNPVTILPDGALIAGYHRLEAAKLLGWTSIRVRIVELDEVDAELAEIDENLRRSNLTVLEESEHMLRREELLEAKGLRAKAGGDGRNQYTEGGGMVPPPSTTADIAKDMGISESSAHKRLQIAKNLDTDAKALIRTNEDIANSTTQLLELARQPAERQRTIADMLISGKAANVNEAVRLLTPPPAPAPVKVEYWTPSPAEVSPELPAWARDDAPAVIPALPPTDKLLVDWTEDDWNAYGAASKANAIQSPPLPAKAHNERPVQPERATVAENRKPHTFTPAEIPGITILNNDARQVGEMVSDPVHLVITSPPYNVGIEYDQHDDDMEDYLPFLTNVWQACYRVMVDGGRIAVVVPFGVGRNPYTLFDCQVAQTLMDAGFIIRGRIIWDKNTTGNRTSWGSFRLPSSPAIRDTTECIIVAHKGGDALEIPTEAKLRDEKGTYTEWLADGDYFMSLAQDHWVVAPESAQRVHHPAPFPVELVTRLMHFYAFPGAHVLDPFGGSGTVGVAAKQLGCKATLVEISAAYCALAQERITS